MTDHRVGVVVPDVSDRHGWLRADIVGVIFWLEGFDHPIATGAIKRLREALRSDQLLEPRGGEGQ